MNLKENRRNILEYLKEFNKSLPKKSSLFSRKSNVDISKLEEIEDKIMLFYDRGILLSPMSIDRSSINAYTENLDLVKQFPTNLKPEMIMESRVLEQTKNTRHTRKILIPSVRENDSSIMADYDKMMAYYLLMGGNNPIQRFSRVEMSMKQYGIKPDMGVSIMKYGDEITTKLEELAMSKTKSPKEWETFKGQVLHSFLTAEKIGNKTINPEEHEKWEERLIKLGILERKLDKGTQQEEDFKTRIRHDGKANKDDKNEQRVALETALQKNAEQTYIKTGMIPIGYRKDENGKIVRIKPEFFTEDRVDKLSASRNNLSTDKNKKMQGIGR